CALDRASIFDALEGTLSPAPGKLGVARLGHASTELVDGGILISGGIGSDATGSAFVRDLEVYNPRTLLPPYDRAGTGLDLDDPLLDELMTIGATRAPGAQATLPSAPDKPARPCGEL